MSNTSKLIKHSRNEATRLVRLLQHHPHNQNESTNEVKIANLCAKLDRNWAIVVLIEAWSLSLSECSEATNASEWRPAIKNAIAILQKSTIEGEAKSVEKLKELVYSSYSQLASSIDEVYFVATQNGSDIPTTQDIKYLLAAGFHNAPNMIGRAIDSPINSVVEELFPSSEAPHLNRLPFKKEGIDILRQLAARIFVALHGAAKDPEDAYELFLLDDNYFSQVYDGDQLILSFTYDQLADTVTKRANDSNGEITANPFFVVGNSICSSCALIIDSLAPWLLSAIQNSVSLRQEVISNVFEEKVLRALLSSGFSGGTVEESGSWRVYNASEAASELELKSSPIELHNLSEGFRKPPGEIDILAITGDSLLMIECKSLFTLGNMRNIKEKLDHESPWRSNAKNKIVWLQDALAAKGLPSDFNESLYAFIVIEGVNYLDETGEPGIDIPLINFATFQHLILEAKRSYSV